MKGHKFVRTSSHIFKRLGGRKQIWRRPRGRHNKLREKVKGKPIRPTIGFRKPERVTLIIVNCLRDLNMVEKGKSVLLGKMGKKKRKMFIEKLNEKNVKVLNK